MEMVQTELGEPLLNDLIEITHRGMVEVRDAIHQLDGLDVEIPVKETMMNIIEHVRQTSPVTIEFVMKGEEQAVSKQTLLTISRCLQELLTNVIQIGKAEMILVTLQFGADYHKGGWKMNKNILVCVSNQCDAEAMIRKGVVLSNAFGGKCFVTVLTESGYNELDYHAYQFHYELQRIADDIGIGFSYLPKQNKKLVKLIVEMAKNKEAQCMVLAQKVVSKWNMMVEGTLINDLFIELDGVDLYIVETKDEEISETKLYDKGVVVSLSDFEGVQDFILDQENVKKDNVIFYHKIDSEFESGVLKVTKISGNKHVDQLFKVVNGKVVSVL